MGPKTQNYSTTLTVRPSTLTLLPETAFFLQAEQAAEAVLITRNPNPCTLWGGGGVEE